MRAGYLTPINTLLNSRCLQLAHRSANKKGSLKNQGAFFIGYCSVLYPLVIEGGTIYINLIGRNNQA